MSEFEWENRRVPRARTAAGHGLFSLSLAPVREYVTLECPRESVAWVVGSRAGGPSSPTKGGIRKRARAALQRRLDESR